MADTPFQYDEEVLSSCATSSYAEALLGSGGEIASKSRVKRLDLSCQKLFQQHASHYGRDREAANDNDTQNRDRLHRFVSNVVFVYRHNNELLDEDETNEPAGDEDENDDINVAGTSATPRHRITLNRFSDRHENELPLMDEGVAEEFLPNFESLPLLGVENEYYGESRELGGAGSIFSKLEFENLVQSVTATTHTSSLGFTFPSTNIGAFRSYFLSDRHRFDDEVPPLPGSASSSSPVFIWSKKGQSSLYLERETDRKRHSVRKDKMDGSDATPYAPPPDGRGADRFRKSLDWSTTDNPDGVPIVHPVIDQGSWYVHVVRSRSIHHTWSIFVLVTWFLTFHTSILFHRPTVVPAGQYQRQAPSRQMPRVIEHSRHIRTPRKGSLQNIRIRTR